MPRNVTISAEVGVLMNSSSMPAAFEYCRECARKMLRLQKPEPCVDLMPPAACAKPPIPTPILIVVTAAAPFRNFRRDATAAPEKSILESLGKCVQPTRSHMIASLVGRRSGRPLSQECRHANRREPPKRPALAESKARPMPAVLQ